MTAGRPRASLGRILEDLGDTLLELVAGDPEPVDEVGGVVIHDPLDELALPRHALVLGVGVHQPAEIAALLAELGEHGAAGLVVRAPVTADERLAGTVERSGVALLGLTRGASWTQLAAMLRSLIAEGDVGDTGPETLGGMPSGDLFTLANAISTLLDAPITIEDRSSRVLAFSGRQDEADPSRIATVLGRQVPQRFTRILEERGVFHELYRSEDPIEVAPMPGTAAEITLRRVALAIRAGDEILGSIWAAVRSPLSAERTQALRDAAKLVALHLLRLRAGADVERRLRADLVATALEAGPGAADALTRLGLADAGCLVLALTPVGLAEDEGLTATHAQLVAERQRLTDAFSMHLSAVYPRSAAALIGDVGYGIVGCRPDRGDAEQRAVRVTREFLGRIGSSRRVLVGVGSVAHDHAGLARSRAGADRALRVLRRGNGSTGVARIADVYVDALLIELADLAAARGDQPSGPVARLLAYDAKRRTCLVETLHAWLTAFGDVVAAATTLHTHPNTFRYRLRRLAEVGGIDLADPDARFAAMLELRLMGYSPPAARSGPGS
ncbi:PucR family transcriptional regulator [Actinocatenispora thailandica]|uniref:PucR family transcriptional regulator n=1 Tax=Actinocatenispora thailandica TaxID=227318 RepID=A0A7R7DSK6_9ACTN|nr:PucR family transcriptional regulator [Actinocatenispora thailandica]